jgi:hypothetical protein
MMTTAIPPPASAQVTLPREDAINTGCLHNRILERGVATGARFWEGEVVKLGVVKGEGRQNGAASPRNRGRLHWFTHGPELPNGPLLPLLVEFGGSNEMNPFRIDQHSNASEFDE